MIKTTGVYHIGIPCNDVDRAVKFYTEILGMSIAKLNRDDMGKGLSRADLRSGDSMVVLFQRPKPLDGEFIEREGATHQAFTVSRDDFELAKQNMKIGASGFTPPRPSTVRAAAGFISLTAKGICCSSTRRRNS